MVYHSWPHPANENDDVVISFSVPETDAGNVISFEALDMMGRKVWMNEGTFASGYHEVKWRRSEVEPKGMYIVSVRLGNEVKQLRVVLR